MNASQRNWSDYVRRVTGNLTYAQIAERVSGISPSNVGRWLRAEPGMVRAETVIAFAAAFDKNPLEALTAAGYLSANQATSRMRPPLSEYDDDELLAELSRRIKTDGASPTKERKRPPPLPAGVGLRTRSEAAQYLRMSPRKLDELIKSGRIAALRDGRSIRISALELDRYIADLPPVE